MSFGKNIGYYRKQLKITQEELAERLYVSRQTISRWENDSVFPDVETVIKLCELFGCSMDTLVRGDAEAEANTDTPKASKKEDDGDGDGNDAKVKIEVEIDLEKDDDDDDDDDDGDDDKKSTRRSRIAQKINNVISSVTMLLASFFYVIYGLLFGVWSPTWIVFIVGAGICALSSVITEAIE